MAVCRKGGLHIMIKYLIAIVVGSLFLLIHMSSEPFLKIPENFSGPQSDL